MEETAQPEARLAEIATVSPAPPSTGLQLAPIHLLMAVLPLAIVIGGDLLLQYFKPAPPLLEVTAGDITHQEGAARIHLMAAFLLVAGAGAAAVAFLARMLARLDVRSMVAVGIGLAVMGAIGFLHYDKNSDYQMQDKVSAQLHCAAARAADAPRLKTVIKLADQPSAGKQCESPVHEFIRDVTDWESVALAAAIPALVFGAITCLAMLPLGTASPATAAEADARKAAEVELLNRQIGRLNIILYLSAALLVAGILFAGAYYHYPEFLLGGDTAKAFEKHAQALILYHSINHSLLIASFYVPAAAILAHRCSCLLTGEANEKLGAKFLAPLQLAKSGLAIFAPIAAGLIADVITLA